MSDAAIEEILSPDYPVLPDYAQLGGRLFVCDGRYANKVVLSSDGSWRPMGAMEQVAPLDVEFETSAGGPLEQGKRVTYGLRRVVRAKGLEVTGGLAVQYYQIPPPETEGDTPAAGSCDVTILPFELSVPFGTVTYQLFRSKPENTQMLYLAAELTDTDVRALEDGRYTDDTDDDDLDLSVTVNLESDGMELTIPPCRYIRAWRGALVCGGYRKRSVEFSGTAESDALTVEADSVTADDIGAYVSIEGEQATYQIVGVDGTTVKLNEAIDGSYADAKMTVWRDNDVVYVSRPLPGNIEVYSAELGRLITNAGADNEITGIAANGTYAYIFRKDNVEIVTGTAAAPVLEPFPSSPPGCRGHATIADRYSPYVIYYAGANGVWVIAGSEAKRISASMDPFIRDGLDHSQDEFAHAVYSPKSGMDYLFAFSVGWEKSGVRMPDTVLMYDTQTGHWTRGEMYASCSGLWRSAASGELVPVIGLPGGVARLETGDTDGGVQVDGTIGMFGDDWFGLAGDTDLSAVLPGMPVFFGDGRAAERRMVKSVADGVVDIYGEIPDGCTIGTKVVIGAIRWRFTTPELGLSGAFDRNLKLETLSIAHERADNTLDVEVNIRGIGAIDDRLPDEQEWRGRIDFATRSISRLDGRATGLRAASMQMVVAGPHSPACVKGVRVQMEKVSR